MGWDVDELIAVARLGGHISDDAWNNPDEMEVLRKNTQEKLKLGWIPDLEYGKWIRPEDKDGTDEVV